MRYLIYALEVSLGQPSMWVPNFDDFLILCDFAITS